MVSSIEAVWQAGAGVGLRSLGIPQPDRSSSMLQTIAVATARLMRFVLEDLTKDFIRVVLDELAHVADPLRLR